MSNPNFVSDLVAMAKAFEELPQVREELANAVKAHAIDGETIQRLELRIIDLKNELEAAHSATRKAEVERDHAEEMFLQADDRFNAFNRLFQAFQGDAAALVKAAQPAEPEAAPQAAPAVSEPTVAEGVAPTVDPGPAIGTAFHGDPGNIDSVSSGPQGSRETGEQSHSNPAESASSPSPVETLGHGAPETSTEGVSVHSDPTPSVASSFESDSSASTSESEQAQPEGNRVPDPTASSSAGDGHSPADAEATPSVDTSADASSTATLADDDVGYHNEPKVHDVNAPGAWDAWDAWAARMSAKYGLNNWPMRDAVAAQ